MSVLCRYLDAAILSTLCPPSLCPPSYKPCVPRLNERHHVSLVSSVLVPAIMFNLCLCLNARHHVYFVLPSWCPSSYQSFILVLAIMSSLRPPSLRLLSFPPCAPRLNDRHYLHLVSSVFAPTIMSTLCLCHSASHHIYLCPCLGVYHHMNLLSWCLPSCQP